MLSTLESRRPLFRDRGCRLLLVLDPRETDRFQTACRDLYSSLSFLEQVAFVPQEVDPEAARRALADSYSARLGRLDLRGFVRSELEDVSWRVEDIYQEVHVEPPADLPCWPLDPSDSVRFLGQEPTPLSPLLAKLLWLGSGLDAPVLVLLGHPGSGKTFFLRWCALRGSQMPSFLGMEQAFPVLLPLAACARGLGPVDLYAAAVEHLLTQAPPAAHGLAAAQAQGRVLYLLDGLDEPGDAEARTRLVEAISRLREQSVGCPILVTSRVAGYWEAPISEAWPLRLAPFGDSRIRGFLKSWCGLCACALRGNTPTARDEGEAEGAALANDVLASPEIAALARNPLMLTVLALVHRAGVRLPDHRVELYEHSTRVLIERWNRVRSLAGTAPAPPLKAADAIRLLGPVALHMVERGSRAMVSEPTLLRLVQDALAHGNLRGLASAEEAVELFRRSLGLLLEVGPGWYSFLHLTFVEFYAARELVRTGRLEGLAAEPRLAFRPEWREVLLLAAAELSVLRADDARLGCLVQKLVSSLRARRGRPSSAVPSLLTGLLADDPGLSDESFRMLLCTLVPKWWLERKYGRGELGSVLAEAHSLVERLRAGPRREMALRCLQQRLPDRPQAKQRRLLAGGGPVAVWTYLRILSEAGLELVPSLRLFLEGGEAEQEGALIFGAKGAARRGILALQVSGALKEAMATLPAPRQLGFELRDLAGKPSVVRLEPLRAEPESADGAPVVEWPLPPPSGWRSGRLVLLPEKGPPPAQPDTP